MAIHLPEDLARSIRAEVLSGHFATADALVAAAVREYLRRKPGQTDQPDAAAGSPARAEPEAAPQELQRRLLEAGVLSEIKPPITDLTPYRNRQAVPIQGDALSDTVIHERR